jgi:hypothetical protein
MIKGWLNQPLKGLKVRADDDFNTFVIRVVFTVIQLAAQENFLCCRSQKPEQQ